jgi:class 3 adenylate cyclase
VTSKDEISEMSLAFNDLVGQLEEKAGLRSILDRSVSSAVADKLLAEGLTLSGEMREITALFADIRGFTSLVESRPAKAVVQMLNEYFGAFIPRVQRHGGVVDKLIGDEIFAVFGAPVDLEDDAIAAVRAALDMREALEEVNRSRVARGDPPITFGVGMNSGSAVAGGLGSDTHLEYTVVGNAVNIAARLCSEAEAGQSTCNSPNTSRMCAGLPSGSFAKHRMQSCSRRSGTSSSVRVEGLGGSTFNVLCTISSTVRPSEGMWPDRIS